MKKAQKNIKYFYLLGMILCLLFFNAGCGLDTFYVIESPVSVIYQPECISIDPSNKYFSFWTNESTQIAGFTFSGTDVYYKIYSNYNLMKTEVDNLISFANNTDSSSTAADKMMNPSTSSGYAYKALKVRDYNEYVLIPSTGSNQRVSIRLTDYQSLYPASITVNDQPLYDSTTTTVPMRNVSEHYSFNFGRSGTYDKVPASSGEDDVKYTSVSEAGKWYVAMFAVAVGHDATYTNYYSNILYLGSVTIDSNSYDN